MLTRGLSNVRAAYRGVDNTRRLMATAAAQRGRTTGPMQATIEQKVTAALQPSYFEVINESHMHSVPRDSETHFKLVVVAPSFEGETLLKRHRRIHSLLAEELSGGVHALSLVLKTPAEFESSNGAIPSSPLCLGGSKKG